MIQRHHFSSIDSTHRYAALFAEKLEEGQNYLFTADQQTAGIGQYKRKWISPPGVNIYATFLIPFPLDKQHLLCHTAQVAALSVAYVLEGYSIASKIKWPNDLLLKEKKVGGILCENKATLLLNRSGYSALVLSVGLNVNMQKEACESIDQPATSLLIEAEKEWDREKLLGEIQQKIIENLERLKEKEFSDFQSELNDHLAYLHQCVDFQMNDQILQGIFEGINAIGGLRLRLPSGEIKEFLSGRINPLSKEC